MQIVRATFSPPTGHAVIHSGAGRLNARANAGMASAARSIVARVRHAELRGAMLDGHGYAMILELAVAALVRHLAIAIPGGQIYIPDPAAIIINSVSAVRTAAPGAKGPAPTVVSWTPEATLRTAFGAYKARVLAYFGTFANLYKGHARCIF